MVWGSSPQGQAALENLSHLSMLSLVLTTCTGLGSGSVECGPFPLCCSRSAPGGSVMLGGDAMIYVYVMCLKKPSWKQTKYKRQSALAEHL